MSSDEFLMPPNGIHYVLMQLLMIVRLEQHFWLRVLLRNDIAEQLLCMLLYFTSLMAFFEVVDVVHVFSQTRSAVANELGILLVSSSWFIHMAWWSICIIGTLSRRPSVGKVSAFHSLVLERAHLIPERRGWREADGKAARLNFWLIIAIVKAFVCDWSSWLRSSS